MTKKIVTYCITLAIMAFAIIAVCKHSKKHEDGEEVGEEAKYCRERRGRKYFTIIPHRS